MVRVAILGLILAFPAVAWAETKGYTLQPGDTLALRILSVADLSVQATIDLDGKISLPFIGEIMAENRTLAELRDQTATTLNGEVYRYVNNQGVESFITIGRKDVQLVVAEYRPIVVYGAVLTHGQIPFRPGMTVRSALAVAGLPSEAAVGNDTTTALRAADLQGEVRALTARRDHRISVTGSLIREMQQLDDTTLPSEEMATTATTSSELQSALSDMRLAWTQNRMERISRSVETIDERLEILNERERAESEALAEETKVKERIDNLFERGIVNLDRMSDVNRSQLFVATRLLQTQDAVMQAEMEKMDLEQQKEQLVQERLIELAQQIEESNMETNVLNARLAAANRALSLLGLTAGDEDQIRVVQIYRGSGVRGVEKFRASMDDSLRPGDILEVSHEVRSQ